MEPNHVPEQTRQTQTMEYGGSLQIGAPILLLVVCKLRLQGVVVDSALENINLGFCQELFGTTDLRRVHRNRKGGDILISPSEFSCLGSRFR
jgi:hypothetical protein